MIGIVILYFNNPFGSFEELQRKLNHAPVSPALTRALTDDIDAKGASPQEFVTQAFEDHDLVFLGEFSKVKDHLDFLVTLIPHLYDKGIKNMGIEYVLYQDRELLANLITSSYYDEPLAHKLLFNYMVIWGYKEYADLFKGVWEFNQNLEEGQEPFMITPMAVKHDYSQIKTVDDIENPEVMKKVYSNGIPDEFIANVVQKEFIDQNKKALLYTHLHTGFTRFKYYEFIERARFLGFSGIKKAGQLLYDNIGDRVMTIALHAPFPTQANATRLDYPLGGAVDSLLKDPARKPFGILTKDTALGYLRVNSTTYQKGYDDLELRDLCDGYIALAPLGKMDAVRHIPDFINERNIDQAIYNFVGPKDPNLTAKELNTFIYEDAALLEKLLKQFQ